MIVEIFAPRNYEEILAIPLSRERTQDALIWKENRKHEFSVKSAYHVALWLNKQEVTEHSQAGADGELVRISCQLVTICTSEEWTWIETVNSVANNLKRVHTCCGSVHLLVMLVSVQWESAEMQEWRMGFFPAISSVGGEIDNEGTWTVGYYNAGNLERKEQRSLWKVSDTTSKRFWMDL